MENTLKLTQLKCASCRSTLSRADKFETQIKCPYCGTVNELTGVAGEDIAAPERIIVFKTNKDDFGDAVCKYFVEQDYTVNDIFEKIHLENATPIYLPMYLFEGKYEADYKCDIGYIETQQRFVRNFSDVITIKDKKITKWMPTAGTARDNYAFLSLAFEGEQLIPELAEWTKIFPYKAISAQNFKADLVEKGSQILPHNLDKEATWHKWGASIIQDLAEEKAYEQASSGAMIRDFKTTFSYDQKHDGRLFLVPFWFVYYYYDNQKHFVLLDGIGENIRGTTPPDINRQKATRRLVKLGKWSLRIGIIMGIIIGINLGGFVVGTIEFVGIWQGLKYFSKYKVKNIIKTAREIRHEACKKIVKNDIPITPVNGKTTKELILVGISIFFVVLAGVGGYFDSFGSRRPLGPAKPKPIERVDEHVSSPIGKSELEKQLEPSHTKQELKVEEPVKPQVETVSPPISKPEPIKQYPKKVEEPTKQQKPQVETVSPSTSKSEPTKKELKAEAPVKPQKPQVETVSSPIGKPEPVKQDPKKVEEPVKPQKPQVETVSSPISKPEPIKQDPKKVQEPVIPQKLQGETVSPPISNPEPTKQPIKKDTVLPLQANVDPAKLEGDINRKLRQEGLSGVTAIVSDNLEITLKGSVGSKIDKNRAFDIAKTFKEKIKDKIFVIEQ